MTYEQKDGQGSLFKNPKDGVETRPDYKGSATIDGQQYWVSGWIRDGEKGKWMSLKIEPKDKRDSRTTPATMPDEDDRPPF